MPASARTFLNVCHRELRVIGPLPVGLGHNQRLSRCEVQSRRSSASTGAGSGTQRSLLPLPMTRIRLFLPSIAVTSRIAASLMRSPQAYISRKQIRAIGFLTPAIRERASASERTQGRRLRLGALTLFLRTAPSRDRACARTGIAARHAPAGTCRARRRARRAGAAGSFGHPLRRACPASAACASPAPNRLDVGSPCVGRETGRDHVVDHTITQGCHRGDPPPVSPAYAGAESLSHPPRYEVAIPEHEHPLRRSRSV